MGRGPEEAIARKLIRKFFKFNLKRSSFDTSSGMLGELQSSWEKFGTGSIESRSIVAKIDAATEKDEQEYRNFKKTIKTYPILMNSILLKPKTKYQKKGNSQKGALFRQQSTQDPYLNIILNKKF